MSKVTNIIIISFYLGAIVGYFFIPPQTLLKIDNIGIGVTVGIVCGLIGYYIFILIHQRQ